MHISVTANGVSLFPALTPDSVPEAVAVPVALAEALMERVSAGETTRVVFTSPDTVMDSLVPGSAVVQLLTNSEIVAEGSPHFRDVLVEPLRARYMDEATATNRIHIDLTTISAYSD